MAENATHTLHNLPTLHGAVVRDPRVWARYLTETVQLFGAQSDIAFASHHWPVWGRERVLTFPATRTPGALSLTPARALRVLAEEGPLSSKKLPERTETTGAGATQLVNGLEQAGCVARERPPGDRRSVVVTLTAAGTQRHRERERLLADALNDTLHDLDDPALDAATEVLRRLALIHDGL
jgi:DNA-binding MarR family transcriptional regulator